MKSINNKYFHRGIIVLEIIILLVLLYKIINIKDINYFFAYDTLESGEGLYLDSFGDEAGCYVDNSMESRENCIRTTPILLNKGSYEIKIDYETSTNGQSYSFTSQDATYRILSGRERCALSPGSNPLILHVNYGQKVNEFQIQFNYNGDGYLVIRDVEIKRTADREKQQFFSFILLILIVEMIYWMNRKKIWQLFSMEQKYVMLLTGGLILLSSYAVFSPFLYNGHDLNFHLMRIEGIKDGLLSGVFPVKIQPTWLSGNGYAVSVYYGDLFLYFPAILRIIGFSIGFSYNAYIIAVNVITVIIAYFCAKGYSNSRYIGLLGALVYTLSPYRLTCIFVRAAVGEYTAMAFIPLIFYGLYCIAYEDYNKKKYATHWLMLVIGFSGIIQSHIITCEIIGIIFGVLCIILWKRLIQKSRFYALLKAAIGTVVINAFFLIPFIDYMKIGGVQATEANSRSFIQTEGIFLSQLFSIFPHAYGKTYGVVEGTNIEEMSLCVGLPFLVAILLCLLYYLRGHNGDKLEYKRNLCILLVSGILIFMSTIYFPWDWLGENGRLLELMVKSIQYPWRLLSIISFFLSFLVCSILVIICKGNTSIGKNIMLFIGVSAVITGGYFMSSLVSHNDTLVIQDESQLNSSGIMGAEYLPINVNASLLNADEVYCSQEVIVSDYEKEGTRININIANYSDMSQEVSVPLIYYRGYSASDVITKNRMDVISGDNGRVTCVIPADYAGIIEIKFKEPIYWRIGELISLLGLVLIIFCFIKKDSILTGKNLADDAI